MICACTLAGTATCNSCLNNPNQQSHSNNFITWINFAERTCHKVIPDEMEGYVFCSNCGAEIGEYGYPNYCPNCGAKVVDR